MKEDQAVATAVVAALVAAPGTRQLFLGGTEPAKITRLLTVPPLAIGALIDAGVEIEAIKSYADSDNALKLLAALKPAVVASDRINSLAPLLGGLGTYVNHEASRADLVTLLANKTPADIRGLLQAAPGPALTRTQLILATIPHAASAADLIQIFTLCNDFMWDPASIIACLTGQPLVSNLAALTGAVHADHLALYNKNTHFSSWLHAVSKLIDAGYVTVSPSGPWTRLKGYPVTDERFYEVRLVVDGTLHDSFCVHFHPEAAAASVGNVNASRSHFKPQSSGNTHYGYAQGPESLCKFTQSHP